jgi:hypothetical protein
MQNQFFIKVAWSMRSKEKNMEQLLYPKDKGEKK